MNPLVSPLPFFFLFRHSEPGTDHLASVGPEPEQGEEKQRNPTQTISLEEFTFHPRPSSPDSSHRQDTEHGDPQGYYSHPCRCSGQYTISLHELEQGVDVVGCEGCGEWVGVGYEVVEEEE